MTKKEMVAYEAGRQAYSHGDMGPLFHPEAKPRKGREKEAAAFEKGYFAQAKMDHEENKASDDGFCKLLEMFGFKEALKKVQDEWVERGWLVRVESEKAKEGVNA